MTNMNEALLEKRSSTETMARMRELYEESNSGIGKELRDLLERTEESDPGFSERVSAALDNREALYNLTLRDAIEHAKLWHLDERPLEFAVGRIDDDILRMVKAISKEWRMCTACVRAAIAVWIAMPMRCDLGVERLHPTVPEGGTGAGMAGPKKQQMARPRRGSRLRVAKLYEEFNYGSKEAPEDLHDMVLDLLDMLKESNPGFRERIADALETEDLNEAALGLTLNDIVAHTMMWHLDERTVGDNACTDNLVPDIRRMVEAISKECGVCVSCGRAAVAGWIARTMAWDLGPRTTPDPLMVPRADQASPSGAE